MNRHNAKKINQYLFINNKIIYLLLFVLFLVIVLSQFSIKNDNKFVIASEKAIASVVTIYTSSNINTPRNLFQRNRYTNSENIGSGVVISSEGHIVTNSHLMIPNGKIIIGHNNGEISEGILVGQDNDSDIAIIKTDVNFPMVQVEIGNSSEVRVGDKVLAIGNPYNIGLSVTSGIISATGRDYGNPYLELIQTDAAINPGNSGGALINEEGYLIGINTKIYSKTGSYEGLGFAIPSEKVFQIASELIKFGKVRNAWIGNFRVRPIRVNNNLMALEIIEIGIDGPLIAAGINQGDIIIKINGKPSTWNNLTQSLKLAFPGDIIDLEILNDGVPTLLSIKTEPIN
ncbi:MAG: peptidase A2 [Gammaproteobacteria bacterium TMED186]|nr:MAG: peptidase A2 [Gammaproteobacteria bacterium TMED186]